MHGNHAQDYWGSVNLLKGLKAGMHEWDGELSFDRTALPSRRVRRVDSEGHQKVSLEGVAPKTPKAANGRGVSSRRRGNLT